MKKILFRVILFVGIAGLTGCDNFFEVLPQEFLVQDEYWQKEGDVRQVLFGAYSAASAMDGDYWTYGEIRGDMVDYQGTNWSTRIMNAGYLNPADKRYSWEKYYRVINLCNYVIDYTDEVPDPTFKPYSRQAYKAEARFLRAFEYFTLVRLYKEVPLVLESSKNDNQDFYLPKSDEETVIKQIISDLEIASQSIPDSYPIIEEKRSRATTTAVNALLADVYLWKEDYQSCVDYCNRVDSTRYILLPGEQIYENYYPVEFPYSPEVIFEFYKDEGNSQSNSLYNLTYNRGSGNIYIPTLVAVEKFLDPNELFRQEATMILYSNNTGLIWKYGGTVTGGTSPRSTGEQKNANFIVYRVADIKLMKAEALNQLGRFDEAIKLVNEIRQRSFIQTDVAGVRNKQILEDIILEERCKELAFEGKRWFDLLRYGRRNNFERKADFIQLVIKKLPVNQQRVLANRLNDPYGWYLPIWIEELRNNKNLEQNPFYAPYSDLEEY